MAVTPQDEQVDPINRIEVSRPKRAHTWHFILLGELSNIFTGLFSFTGAKGPVDPGAVASAAESHW